jgi:uncharacterized repeat protein (TIGR03837 family)
MRKRWDIFCKIVDNFGDIGVCWRLSQQLAHEHGLQVRLFIDDFNVASKIITGLDIAPQAETVSQTINGVEICAWPRLESQPNTVKNIAVADVAIETFSCGLPAHYLQKMQSSKTVWINLEYLSAESWVSDFHAKPSQHPTLALTKHYFFPGFSDATGGLIRESNLMATRNAFLKSKALQNEFWRELDLDPTINSIQISLFCYPQANIRDLFIALDLAAAKAGHTINVLLPLNKELSLSHDVLADFKSSTVKSSFHDKTLQKGNLTLHLLPFLTQAKYDHLLWACDLNFVRGEDSWIRAIWAGKPFIWQPYIQAEDADIHKLNAFLDVYLQNATLEIKSALYEAHLAWSQSDGSMPQTWQHLISQLPKIQCYATQQTQKLAEQPDLAAKLVIFSENLSENKV